MESGGSKRRRRLLYACGVSALTIAHKAYGRAEEVQGPTGFLANSIASLAEPIVSPMASQWLAILSFADDQILAAEEKVEALIPPSSHLFDKIESFVCIPDTLPGKFDRGVDIMIRCVPFLEWVLTFMIWGLNLFLSTFMAWVPDDSAKEKEIVVDINCDERACAKDNNENRFGPKSALNLNSSPLGFYPTEEEVLINESFPSLPVAEHEDEIIFKPSSIDKSPSPSAPVANDQGGETVKPVKISYKEVLEMGNNGDAEKKVDITGKEEPQKPTVEKEKPTGAFNPKKKKTTEAEVGRDVPNPNEMIMKEFPILELFDAGWHMKPTAI
ncbi:uncharacterized protein LOC122058085 [Macadamia integrifolia]|uniref:uncharacterized protein LOC122058085 n=1 Tax=Macadamia integrifolia TaxID=60698 RepID=UPI001C4EF988|nr:uncharacterized protein LOC122058085 [Macadamia integrifolia]